METTIQVLQGGEVLYTLTEVIQAQYRDRIREAPALQFTTLYRRAPGITKDCVLFFGGNYFRISQLERSVSGGRYLLSVTAEHESVSLADDALELFSYTGAASGALAELLEGTGMRGVPETDGNVSIYMKNTNRRAVLLGIAAALGGEIDYRGHDILIVSHRGNTELTDILSRGKVSDLSVTVTGSEGDAYVFTMAGAADLSLGDAVLLRDTALGIDTETRIIGIQYDPFQDHLRTFEAGKPIPSIVDFYQKTQKTASEADRKAQDAKETADSAETKADAVERALPDYQKKNDVSASIDTYVNSAAGKASIVASLKGTYATEESLSGYVEKTTLTAEIGAYIDTEAGTAKIVSAASGTYQKISDMAGYVKTSELNTSIGQYIDSAAGIAKIVSAASGTYQKKSDMSGYVQTSALNTSIGQYIDTAAGTAKIVSAASGTYQKKSDMSGYVQTSALNTTIEQYIDSSTGTSKILAKVSGVYQEKSGMGEYAKATALASIEASVSSVESKIELSSSYSKNTIGTNVQALLQLVTNANSSNIMLRADKLYFTGTSKFLTAADVGSSGTTTIDGARIKTGKIDAARIDVSELHATAIYGTGSYDDTKLLSTSTSYLYVGGAGANAAAYYTYIMATNQIILGSTTSGIVRLSMNDNSFAPTSNGTQKLGTSTYQWSALYVKEIYLNGTKLTVSGESSSGGIGTSSSPVSSAYFGTSSYHLVVSNASIIPNSTSTSSSYYQLGSSTRPFNAIYAKAIYLNGTAIGSGSGGGSTSFAGSTVTLGGTTSYYIVANTSRELRPNTTMSSYQTFYLGTSSYFWHYAYIGSEACVIGYDASSKLGFFGKSPVTRITVSNSATVETLISALKSYGLIY